MALELPLQKLTFSRKVRFPINCRGTRVCHRWVDFIVEQVLVELKAKGEIEPVDVVQTQSSLKAAEFEIGLLLNFEVEKLKIKRLIRS